MTSDQPRWAERAHGEVASGEGGSAADASDAAAAAGKAAEAAEAGHAAKAGEAEDAAEAPTRRSRPEQTSDDTDVGWGEAPEPADAHERWLLEQRPPHWD